MAAVLAGCRAAAAGPQVLESPSPRAAGRTTQEPEHQQLAAANAPTAHSKKRTPPPGAMCLTTYAAQCGAYADVAADADCARWFALFTGAPPPIAVAARLCARQAVLVVATTRFAAIARMLATAYGPAGAEAVCELALRWPGAHRPGMQAALAAVVERRDPAWARVLAADAQRLGADPVDEIGAWLRRRAPACA